MIHTVAFVGFGGMATHHIQQYEKSAALRERIRIKGICDIDPARQVAAREHGLYIYPDQEAIFADPEVEIVLIAVPNHLHKEYAIKAMRSGKHVLCEKPATMNSAELTEIMAVAKETDRIFTVDQNRRVNRDYVLMRRSVEAGLIGDVYVIESRVEGSRGVPKGWRTDKAQGGGMMLDWGVHLIDQILYMYPDAKVTNVFCKMYELFYDVDDNFRLTLTLDNGVTAHIEISTNNFITHPRWYVLGKKGTLQIDGWDCEGRIVRGKAREDSWGAEIAQNKVGPSKTMAPRSEESQETLPLHAPTDVEDNLNPTYFQMIDAIEGKAELTIRPEQALRVMKVMEAAFASSETGQAISDII